MSKFFEASLVLLLSIVITTLIVMFLVPVHAFGGASRKATGEDIRPAVFVETSQEHPGAMGQAQQCPFLVQRSSSTSCPYLSALAAASCCPALSARAGGAMCPYLAGQDNPDSRRAATRAQATVGALSS